MSDTVSLDLNDDAIATTVYLVGNDEESAADGPLFDDVQLAEEYRRENGHSHVYSASAYVDLRTLGPYRPGD